MTTTPRPAAPKPPPRHPTPNNESAPLYGGPAAGQTVDRYRGSNWPRFLDGDTGQRIDGNKGEWLLRHPRIDSGAYIASSVPHVVSPYRPAAPVATAFVHSTACVERRLTWQLVATALAGSHAGRALTGGSNNPADVLNALVDACDDLIRLRLGRDHPRPQHGGTL